MFKKCPKEIRKVINDTGIDSDMQYTELSKNVALDIVVGSSNVNLWNELKTAFGCKTNQEFSTVLLKLAEEHLSRKTTSENGRKYSAKEQDLSECTLQTYISSKNNVKKCVKTEIDNKNEKTTTMNSPHIASEEQNAVKASSYNINKIVQIVSDSSTTSKKLNEKAIENEKSAVGTNIITEVKTFDSNSILKSTLIKPSNMTSSSLSKEPLFDCNTSDKPAKHKKTKESPEKRIKRCKSSEIVKSEKGKKKIDHDIRKAPELDVQVDINVDCEAKMKDRSNEKQIAIKIKYCLVCNTQHLQNACPLQNPHYTIADSLTLQEWMEKYKNLYIKEQDENENSTDYDKNENLDKTSFSHFSIPSCLCIKDSNLDHGLSIYTCEEVKSYTQFGPMIGDVIKEVDIPEDFNMKDLWEIYTDKVHFFLNTSNVKNSNWMKFVRPAPSRDERNVSVVCKDEDLFIVTIKNIGKDEELLYWQDSPITPNKKKMEKTTCGGCNMTFAHPLYYRTHCSVFHDVRYSLTIRKYHCKVCGIAVLGKENIMKHAAELHNGQGAYQCQFCKKFFLRLNYLEMHRTYGCSANPHRSRPLCDFCGRKFCQPQKLKVHIKRMHSDMSEVLKEFQCKNCLKILGSRAALQRHLKEVHHKQVEGSCTCVRCGKLFQNKSNLKIHMLTHSGIKPFRCGEKSCNAAFTTKQCLQFHYKKVHSFTEEMMPKIERSVDYTFEAYSGLEDGDQCVRSSSKLEDEQLEENSVAEMDDSSDMDNSVDEKNVDDPPRLHSPVPIINGTSSCSSPSPPTLEPYNGSSLENTKVLTKGSKKWIADDTLPSKRDMYSTSLSQAIRMEDTSNSIEVDEPHHYDHTKLATSFNNFNRHESNASLLVEAALDSVCSESNIDMDVSTAPNSTDALVNNLYNLAHPDTLPDVGYNHSVHMTDSRDINLISPSVNDHISVTDDLNDELQPTQSITGVDYSTFHHEEFSPDNSPSLHQRNNFVRDYINSTSPQIVNSYETDRNKNVSPVSSPPRYDLGQNINVEHNLSSDDSNGIGVQNLSLHNSKNNDVQLDLSIYKSPYFRMKFDLESERKQVYVLEVGEVAKNYMEHEENLVQENLEQNDLANKEFDNVQSDEQKQLKDSGIDRYKYPNEQTIDIRNKLELDLDLRIKTYENIEAEMRNRTYEGTFESTTDFRSKNYDIDSLDTRNKNYESLIEADFRPDRNLEPLVLNPTELQGLDMSARGYHNYTNLNRYHNLYSEVERPSVDLRLNYSPPQPSYTHADILRVVSLDLTPPGRHSVDLSLRTHPLHQIANSRLLSEHALQANPHRLLDQTRLLNTELGGGRHLSDARLIPDTSTRILSDHTTNRLLSHDQLLTNRLITPEQNRLLPDESRLISEQPRLLEQTRLIGESRILPPAAASGSVSPVQYSGYPVSPSPYHPTPLAPRPHATSPTPTSFHHYAAYY